MYYFFELRIEVRVIMFIGSFIKSLNFQDYLYRNQVFKADYKFDEKTYYCVAEKIYRILGKKRKYTAKDAIFYFREAYMVKIRNIAEDPYFYFYKSLMMEIFPYNYIYEKSFSNEKEGISLEKVLLIVISLNDNMSEEIKVEADKSQKILLSKMLTLGLIQNENNDSKLLLDNNLSQRHFKNMYDEIILAISYMKKDFSINSMKIIVGEMLIAEFEYVLEFFRRNG